MLDPNTTAPTDVPVLPFHTETINRSVLIIYIIFSTIGNVLNICLFTSPVLIKTSSSYYLLSTSIANLFVIISVIFFRLLADGFDFDITSNSLVACKLMSYIYYVCLALPPYFTVLACADRWAASCVQVSRRRFATAAMAKRCILAAIVLGCLLYLPVPVTFDIDPQPPPPYCSASVASAFYVVTYYLVIYSILPPSLMIVFSIRIIINVRRRRTRVIPAVPVANSQLDTEVNRVHRRRLSPMQVMLVCQSIIEFTVTLPFSVINLVAIVVDNDDYFLAVYSFVRLLVFFNYVSSFYIYTLSSKLYRNELRKLAKKLFRRVGDVWLNCRPS